MQQILVKRLPQMSPRVKRGVSNPWGNSLDPIGFGVTVILIHGVLWAQDLDSSVAEFLLSLALSRKGLIRNNTDGL